MLSEEERQEIEHELTHYPEKRAACIEALKIVQAHRGWVTDEGLRDIAEFLEMSIDELEDVATFYNMIFRKPVGKHIILLCDSVSCWIMGYEGIRERISQILGTTLGGTTPDQKFTFLPNVCLGACDKAPVMMVDGDLHVKLDPQALEQILAAYE